MLLAWGQSARRRPNGYVGTAADSPQTASCGTRLALGGVEIGLERGVRRIGHGFGIAPCHLVEIDVQAVLRPIDVGQQTFIAVAGFDVPLQADWRARGQQVFDAIGRLFPVALHRPVEGDALGCVYPDESHSFLLPVDLCDQRVTIDDAHDGGIGYRGVVSVVGWSLWPRPERQRARGGRQEQPQKPQLHDRLDAFTHVR